MKIYIDSEKKLLMKKEYKKSSNRRLYIICVISLIMIVENVFSKYQYDTYFNIYLLFPIFLCIFSLFMIVINNRKTNDYFNKVINTPCSIDITYSDDILIINNLYKNTKVINKTDIKTVKHLHYISVIQNKNKDIYVLPNISSLFKKNEFKKNNNSVSSFVFYFLLLICIGMIAFSLFNYLFNDQEIDDSIELREQVMNVSDFDLYTNSAAKVSENMLNNGAIMTNDWHCSDNDIYDFNDTTKSWNIPNDQFIYFSNIDNGFTSSLPTVITNIEDFNNYVFNNKTKKVSDLIYFARKGNNNMIFASQVAYIDNNSVYFFIEVNAGEFIYYQICSELLNDVDLYVIHIDSFS